MSFRIYMAQANPTVGDLEGNRDKAIQWIEHGESLGADFVMFPEMFISGYPIQDLVNRRSFIFDCKEKIRDIAYATEHKKSNTAIGIGGPSLRNRKVYNSYYIIQHGEILQTIEKHHLPNYSVFDEVRQFSKGDIHRRYPIEINGTKVGILICEDAWHDNVAKRLTIEGAEVLLVANGSPYRRDKIHQRHSIMKEKARRMGVPLVYLNMVGGQDDQVFDGGSFIVTPDEQIKVQMPLFDENWASLNLSSVLSKEEDVIPLPGPMHQDYQAMTYGLRDYIHKSGFEKVILGLSGGIDSALVATIAVDALGSENVRLILLPSPWTSTQSLSDASEIARRLECKSDTFPISKLMVETEKLFKDKGGLSPLAKENIQPRLRSLLLMAISNDTGELLLTTGNKSEVATGYTTLYGDMAGTYNPIKDLYKTKVFDICKWRNENHKPWMKGTSKNPIPKSVLEKPPSAELKDDQRDDDLLLPYPILDDILSLLVDQDMSVKQTVEYGHKIEDVKFVEDRVYSSEYKRFQAAPGVRLTERALWLDRRYPVINRWRDKR